MVAAAQRCAWPGACRGRKPQAAWNFACPRSAQERHRGKAAAYNGRPIDPRRAHAALLKVPPGDAIIAIDAGVGPGYVYEYQTFERSRNLLAPQGLAAIGTGYPVGLGAKLAASRRPVVTISGHGSFLYNGAELETSVREVSAAPSAPARRSTATSATSATPSATARLTSTPVSSARRGCGSPTRMSSKTQLRRLYGWARTSLSRLTCCAPRACSPGLAGRKP